MNVHAIFHIFAIIKMHLRRYKVDVVCPELDLTYPTCEGGISILCPYTFCRIISQNPCILLLAVIPFNLPPLILLSSIKVLHAGWAQSFSSSRFMSSSCNNNSHCFWANVLLLLISSKRNYLQHQLIWHILVSNLVSWYPCSAAVVGMIFGFIASFLALLSAI